MPELPEVETIRRQLLPLLLGRGIGQSWTFGTPKFESAVFAAGVIDEVDRRGKYLILRLSTALDMVIHLGMTGRLAVRPTAHGEGLGTANDDLSSPHLRAWWDLDNGTRLEFVDVRRFGRILVVPAGQYDAAPTLATLGPEPFADEFTPRRLRAASIASQRPIKTLLLAQNVVAGLGNIYADEALWRARVRPDRRGGIALDASKRLHRSIIDVLAEGIEHGGTTLRDYRDATGSSGSHQQHLDCYGRSGLPCTACGTPLDFARIDARSTTWCRRCQR